MTKRLEARKAFRAAEKAKEENKERAMAFFSAIRASGNKLSGMRVLLEQVDTALAQMV